MRCLQHHQHVVGEQSHIWWAPAASGGCGAHVVCSLRRKCQTSSLASVPPKLSAGTMHRHDAASIVVTGEIGPAFICVDELVACILKTKRQRTRVVIPKISDQAPAINSRCGSSCSSPSAVQVRHHCCKHVSSQPVMIRAKAMLSAVPSDHRPT